MFRGHPQLVEHVAGVWVAPGGVSQGQETVVCEWCYETALAPEI